MKEGNTSSMANQYSSESHHDHQIDQELKKPNQDKDNNNVKEQEHEQNDTNTKEIVEAEDISGRERLKRHRVEMGGRVWIPDIWGQEEFLKDWIDCTVFDPPLLPANKILTARTALVEEGRRFHYRC